MKKLVAVVLLFCAVLSVKAADWTPLQISIWPSRFQVAPEDVRVSGLKLNLPFGGNDSITGLDIGLASTSQKCSALQVNVLINRVHDEFSGWQIGLINQDENANGVVIGIWNVTADCMRGVQVGVMNSAMETHGVQIGLINYTEFMTGFQIGLVNIITKSQLPFFPIINFCF